MATFPTSSPFPSQVTEQRWVYARGPKAEFLKSDKDGDKEGSSTPLKKRSLPRNWIEEDSDTPLKKRCSTEIWLEDKNDTAAEKIAVEKWLQEDTDAPLIIRYSSKKLIDEDSDTPLKKRSSPGKWMIFNDCTRALPKSGMTYHDFAWQTIKTLVESNPTSVTGLSGAKATTGWSSHSVCKTQPGYSRSQGMICCYTSDYSDKVLVKKAADAIRRAYLYPKDILYKADIDTSDNKYCHLGSSFISIYKHTIKNEMYERDSKDPLKWNIVDV